MKVNVNDTVQTQRGQIIAAIEYIGSVGTGTVPFKQVAELVSSLQQVATSDAIVVNNSNGAQDQQQQQQAAVE